MSQELTHKPVLTTEVLEGLTIKSEGVYVDATFGRGGHVHQVLQQLGPKGRVFALDKDPEAIKAATKFDDKRLVVKQGSFTMLKAWMSELDLLGKVDGVLLDLGVSSPQLDAPERGFSFMKSGPLDMRMDPERGVSAASWVNQAKAEEMAVIFKEYGEERYAKRIAAAIVKAREVAPITTTVELAEIVAAANPKWEKHKHPATRVFQAIRIFINNELDELKSCLEQCLDVLAIGGRLVVISFHSLEDRIVKNFMRRYSKGEELPAGLPIKQEQLSICLKRIGKKIKASKQEIASNIRARSAVLRIAEKIS